MPQQLQINWQPLHVRENNPLSQMNLDLMKDKFSEDCYKVLKALINGERLTVKGAMITGLSNSLPRRLGDLRKFGITHQTEWIYINNKKSHVEYFMSTEDKIRASQVLMSKSRLEKV